MDGLGMYRIADSLEGAGQTCKLGGLLVSGQLSSSATAESLQLSDAPVLETGRNPLRGSDRPSTTSGQWHIRCPPTTRLGKT